MRKRLKYFMPILLVGACVGWLWLRGHEAKEVSQDAAAQTSAANAAHRAALKGTNSAIAKVQTKVSAAVTNRLAFRLSNTPRTIGQLERDRHAVLLENAFIDTSASVTLKIPSQLKAKGDPGAYIVQARGPIDPMFRGLITGTGGQIVSYIPNNAYLAQMSAGEAAALQSNPLVQAVLPYEPYYKVQSSLLGLAVNQDPLPPGMFLTLGIFAANANATLAQIQQLGGLILSQDRSPFGLIVRVRAPQDWVALADLPGVQLVEPARLKKSANDLSRVALGISVDTVTNVNYLNLSGSNVLVDVNDTGIDAQHPDLGPTRVFGDFPTSLIDSNGHGTHVAGIIAGNGTESSTLANNPPSGSVTNANFRGKAPLASLFSVDFLDADSYLQETAAKTNALISNNSWVNDGDNEYDLAAASYDAAVRDAIPEMTGPQPVLFVFAAGNDGAGPDDGTLGLADSIESPATAKNVITVGSLEQLRNITNVVTALDGTSNAVWQPETDSAFEVAGYSARGNVGLQTEGTFGRFKPDVVAPGSFVVSTRSEQWDQPAYYNPTNFHSQTFFDEEVVSNSYFFSTLFVPANAVAVEIQVLQDTNFPLPFPTNMPIFVSALGFPVPTNSATYDFVTSNNMVSIPPDSGGLVGNISDITDEGLLFAVGDATNLPVFFDLFQEAITTNDNGNELEVLSNLNNTIGPWYRYETGTSMAAGSASGVLALMQDFFTNTLHETPSPALLKAMLINGARMTGGYLFSVTNPPNIEGWGQIQLPNSIPASLTNTTTGATNTMFFVDQSPTNVLKTGDQRTYIVTVPSVAARSQMLRVTLAWTDPPGNPAAAIKLVNDLELVVTNLSNGSIYYANNFGTVGPPPVSMASSSNDVPLFDPINNVKNIAIPPLLGTNYSVTVIGAAVNVNAVTAEQTNIVQDFALVISSGDGSNSNGISVTAAVPAVVTNLAPLLTYLAPTNGIYFDQIVGANAPWLSTNDITFGTNSPFATNAVFHIGQANQWRFYVISNTFAGTNAAFTNAAFIIFNAATLALPREGVFAKNNANSTRPEADTELFVATAGPPGFGDPNAATITNLNPVVLSNCLAGVNGDGASYSRLGTEFVAYNNSSPNQIYYIGVQVQDQTAGEFGIIPIFSAQPFSSVDTNGDEHITGANVPVAIPDGNNRYPGSAFVVGLALTPMEIRRVVVTNTFEHQNFGDLVGSLSHTGDFAVLNNHDGFGPITPAFPLVYDDSGQGDITAFPTKSDGPGTLQNFVGQEAIGPWLLNEIDDSFTQTGSVTSFDIKIQPHQDLGKLPLLTVSIPPGTWFYDFVNAQVGDTNLLVVGTNVTVGGTLLPVQMFVNEGTPPTLLDTNFMTSLTNGVPPGSSISVGPPLTPDTYYIGIFNPPGNVTATVELRAFLSFDASAISTVDYDSAGAVPLIDDAVMRSDLLVTNPDIIQKFNVGLRVDHQRISDLSFTLIDPNGNRYLLMENRGGQSTNGCGLTVVSTNMVQGTASGTSAGNTNTFSVGETSGTFPISYNFFTLPDEMTVYYGTNLVPANLIYDSGLVAGSNTVTVRFPPATATETSTNLTIVMNQFGNEDGTNDEWTYTAGGVLTNYYYLSFTEDTNLTTTPIKFAPPPFTPKLAVDTNNYAGFTNWSTAVGGNGHWYKAVSSSGLNWDACDGLAHAAGGYLATLTSTSEDNFVFGLINSSTFFNGSAGNGSGPAIGGIKQPGITNAADGWGWETGEPFVFHQWFPGQPDNDTINGLQNRIVFFSGNGGSPANFWDDINETDPNVGGYVIERNGFTNQSSNLYYQAEQSLDPIVGTPANGTGHVGDTGVWQLEVLDNRAGATNNASLVSWQLEFEFANTNIAGTPTVFTNGPTSGTVGPGGIAWFKINTPTNADLATNSLLFGSQPLNLWFSTNNPPSVTTPSDQELLPNSTFGSAVIGTNFPGSTIPPAYFVPGDFYFLGVQNPNSTPANYTVDVTFHLFTNGSIITEPATNITFTTATLDALVTPNGLVTGVYFEYGTTTNYGLFSTNVVLTSNLGVPLFMGIGVTNLAPGTLYHFQAVDTNSYGTNFGGDLTFITPPLSASALAFTMPATLLTGPSAQLNGMATADGSDTVAWFEWGTTAGYGNLTPATDIGTNFGVVYVTNQITGLTTNFAYHFRMNSSNAFGVVHGYDHVFSQANVVAWGLDNDGQTTPLPTGLTNLVVGIGAGQDFSMAVNYNGSTVVWGQNSSGETNVPPGLTNVVAVSGGVNDCLALKSDGTLAAWGSRNFFVTNIPPILTNAVASASGAFHALALTANGYPVAWGLDSSGQTNIPTGLSNVVAVAGGFFHSLALKNDGTMVAWGEDDEGQIDIPFGVSNVVGIACGDNFSLALKNDGTVVAWGDGNDGDTDVPAGLTNVLAIAAGGSHALALVNDGSVVAWGDPFAGQPPVGLSNVVAVAAGEDHNLALSSLFGLNQTNNAPFWTNGLNGTTVTMDELTTTNITNTALDTNLPAQTLNYVLLNAPSFASINFQGIITLSPGEADGPGTYTITTVVTDNGRPPLSNTNSFTVIVNEVNSAPFFAANLPNNYVVIANDTFAITNTATDTDIPINTLTYSFLTAPSDATIDPATGGITWTPTAADIGMTTTFVEVVTDFNPAAVNSQHLSATNLFTVTVAATNTAPFWTTVPLPNQTINELTNFVWMVSAMDTDTPTNHLTYSLSNAPAGMQISSSGNVGTITWHPSEAQGPGIYSNILVIVNDNVFTMPLTATNSFNITVNEVNSAPQFVRTPPNLTVLQGTTTTVTNSATDSDIPANVLTYSLQNPPTGATINPNTAVITLANLPLGTNIVTTVVTDTNPFALFNQSLTATNQFFVVVTNVFAPPTNAFSDFTIVQTNLNGTNGFMLTWFAPSNDLFNVQWTTNIAPPNWQTFSNTVSYNTGVFTSPTNTQFNFFDDGSQTGGFGPTRFYRLELLGSGGPANTAPFFVNGTPSNVVVNPLSPVTVTNVAADNDLPAQTLTYVVTSTAAGTNQPVITTNGVITWTPNTAQAGVTNTVTTVVTDSGSPNLSVTNSFNVTINPVPSISHVVANASGVSLQWTAPTNDQFQVRWATNLMTPINWTAFAGTITSTNGTFNFMDTNSLQVMKFYQLFLLP